MAQWVRAIAGQARERELTCLAPVSKATVTPALGGMATGCLLRLAADVLLRGGACTCLPHTPPSTRTRAVHRSRSIQHSCGCSCCYSFGTKHQMCLTLALWLHLRVLEQSALITILKKPVLLNWQLHPPGESQTPSKEEGEASPFRRRPRQN